MTDTTVDNAEELEQHLEAGSEEVQQPDPELLAARKWAAKFGWAPKEDWRGKPEDWVDAPEFLERAEQRQRSLTDQNKRLKSFNERMTEDARREGRESAERELREATKAGDDDRAVVAAERLAAHSGPSAEVRSWISQNPWFETDPRARRLAMATCEDEASRGASEVQQLQAAREEVERVYPDLFGRPREPRPEPKVAPQVAGGNRVGNGRRGPKGWDDLPGSVRATMEKNFRTLLSGAPDKVKASKDRMARTYWESQGEAQ